MSEMQRDGSEMRCKRCGANECRIHGFCSVECEHYFDYEEEITDLEARIAELEEENRLYAKDNSAEKRTVDADFRIGRGDGLWENYRVERTLKITLPFGQKELSPVELKEIENYGILLANREQAIIRVEIVDTPYIIFSPTKWKKRK